MGFFLNFFITKLSTKDFTPIAGNSQIGATNLSMYIQNQQIMIDNLILTHGIKGFPFHFLTEDNLVYQMEHCPNKRTLPEQIKKKQVNGTCRGFMIYGKFKSLSYIESKKYPVTKVLFKVPETDYPF